MLPSPAGPTRCNEHQRGSAFIGKPGPVQPLTSHMSLLNKVFWVVALGCAALALAFAAVEYRHFVMRRQASNALRQPPGGDLAGSPTIRLRHEAKEATEATFEIAGLDASAQALLAKANLTAEQWVALFSVRVDKGGGAESSDRPALLGEYRFKDNVLRFEPRFPLMRGLRYRAVFDPSRLGATGEPVVAEFVIPKPAAGPPTVVEHVYPSTNKLPENQLKFYLHFSAPMSRGEAYRHIHLLQASGKEVDLPFLELDEELWDPQGKRFTLFFDPGRIKRGLKPREEVGPSLEEGKSYTLVIDAAWADATGNSLKESYRKPFQVGAPDDQLLEPKNWKVQAPAAGTEQPLTVDFPRPLDHALIERMLWITDAADGRVPGKVTVSAEETRWQFTPEQPWQNGKYYLVAQTALEDLAGNSIGRPFEVDVFRPVQREVKAETVRLPFEVRAGSR